MERLKFLLNKWQDKHLNERELNLILELTKDIQIIVSKELTNLENEDVQMHFENKKDTKKIDVLKKYMENKKSNGVWFGLQWLEEGEYTVNGGMSNKVLIEMKVDDGLLYIKEDGEWLLSSF